jgi:hypothetical protein
MTDIKAQNIPYIADFNQLYEIIEKIEYKFDNSIQGFCLFCRIETSKKIRYDRECEFAINEIIRETNQKLPETALKDSKLTYYTETTSDVEKSTPTKEEYIVKGFTKQKVEKFSTKHFPKFKGTLCKQCKNVFIERAKKCFSHMMISENLKEIYSSMKECHSNYLDLLSKYLD